jgi:serine/threonine protein kinase
MKRIYIGKTQKQNRFINPRQLNVNTILKNKSVNDKNKNSDIVLINNILNNNQTHTTNPTTNPKYLNNKYNIVKYLGEGIQGSLYLANDIKKKRFICKKITLENENDYALQNDAVKQIELELNLLKFLSSNNTTKEYINPCIDYKIIDNNIFTLFPIFNGYSLNHIIKYLRKLDNSSYYKIVFHIIKTILHGLAKIHQSKVAHQNINATSILVSTYTKPKEISIKFTDFGLGCGIRINNNMINLEDYAKEYDNNTSYFNSCKVNNFTPVSLSEKVISEIVDNDFVLISQKYDLFCLCIIFAKLLLFFENLDINLESGYNKKNEQTIIDMIDNKYLSKMGGKKYYKSMFPFINVKDDVKQDILEYLKLLRQYALCKTANRQSCQYVLDKIIIYEKYKNEIF